MGSFGKKLLAIGSWLFAVTGGVPPRGRTPPVVGAQADCAGRRPGTPTHIKVGGDRSWDGPGAIRAVRNSELRIQDGEIAIRDLRLWIEAPEPVECTDEGGTPKDGGSQGRGLRREPS